MLKEQMDIRAQAAFDVGTWCDMETIIDLSDVISFIFVCLSVQYAYLTVCPSTSSMFGTRWFDRRRRSGSFFEVQRLFHVELLVVAREAVSLN